MRGYPRERTYDVPKHRQTAAGVSIALVLTLLLAACGDTEPSPSPASPSADPGTTSDLNVIACATDDPEGVGELTGAWSGSAGGVYSIRQVGDCVWWFGTELEGIEPGVTGQPGFANVASGRLYGTRLEVEYADLPAGTTMGGGGLTWVYDRPNSQLVLAEQRGDWIPFGDSVLTRIEPNASPDATPSASPSP